MEHQMADHSLLGSEAIGTILLKLAPPVMLAQLIQALYNIVDSFFVGKYSTHALTALSVIFPIQVIIIALAVGTGVGVNTYMARMYALGRDDEADQTAGTGVVLALLTWAAFALISSAIMKPYVMTSATSPIAIEYAMTYGTIVCVGSIGTFLEGIWTKVHQSSGHMWIPMAAQATGAVTNMILDPLLIFGIGPIPELGVAGAAWATVSGQVVAAVITGIGGFRIPPLPRTMRYIAGKIYFYGYSSIAIQILYTVYIVILNMILAGFSDAAITVLGLYYKMQSFFFIPLFGLQTCAVPVISYNYAHGSHDRCRSTMRWSLLISSVFMIAGIICFVFFPSGIIRLFSDSAEVLEIGRIAFPIIGCSFISAVFSLMMPVFFQAIGDGKTSLLLGFTRQIFCLVPIFWLLSQIGLNYTWLAFPLSETITGGVGTWLYLKRIRTWSAIQKA